MPKAIKPQFYVYVLRDPRPGKNLQPIYVGKGRGRRARMHWNNAKHHPNPFLRKVFAKICKTGLEPAVEFVSHFDGEVDAYQLEIELIAQYGRRDLKAGPLCNLTNGGEGNSDGFLDLWTNPAFRNAHIERLQKRNADPVFKKANTERLRAIVIKRNADPVVKKAAAESMRKFNADPAVKKAAADRMSRRMNSDPTNGARSRERWADPEFKARASAAMKAAWNDKRRATCAEQSRERWADPEFKSQMAVTMEASKPKRSAGVKAAHAKNPKRREAIAKQARERWNDPELRSRMLRKRSQS